MHRVDIGGIGFGLGGQGASRQQGGNGASGRGERTTAGDMIWTFWQGNGASGKGLEATTRGGGASLQSPAGRSVRAFSHQCE